METKVIHKHCARREGLGTRPAHKDPAELTVNLVGHQDAGDIGAMLSQLGVPVLKVLVGHLTSHVKYLQQLVSL